MPGPDSSYSCLDIHIVWKVDRDDKMEPPIHTEYLRSGGAIILILIVDGANDVISFCMRSAIPEIIIMELGNGNIFYWKKCTWIHCGTAGQHSIRV